ncbi:hypothetical protein mvi_00660 [Methylobacterium indicum]|uniref:Initiator Rep protein domain-containing protein n=1 Tax=Methylobacterium indicum TaxID=1775910 RepID=A0A8H9C3S8_9HYPH|nr:hypothetical protein mvi_00660 [Methylobacterium indicum]
MRGDLPLALKGAEAFIMVAPAVPRPASYLLSPELLAWAPEATARDLALWETLLTLAQAPDGSVQDLQLPRIAGVRQALAALSASGRQAQPRELVDSLHRLFGRERAPLKLKGEFGYRLPSFLGDVLVPGRYGHLDLVTLARFRHRASALLYRRLVGELAAAKARYVAGGAPHLIELTPTQLATTMGLPAEIRVGQLKAAYLTPTLAEIAAHVRAFRVVAEEVHGEKRPGQLHAPLERVVLAIELLPPERLDAVPVRRLPREDFAFLLQQGDAARYRVSGKTLARVSALFAGRSLPGAKAGPGPAVASDVQTRLDLWLAALNEALTGVPVTPEAETRAYRGARLLAAIETEGVDLSFIGFHREEADAPDLQPALDCDAGVRVRVDARKARADRRKAEDRAQANDARRDVRAKRAAGEAPAPIPRETVKVTTPAPAPASAAPSAPELARPDPDAVARAMAILSTPEAKREAKDLGWYWQYGLEFPLTQAGRIGRVFLRAEFKARFPLLHEADALLGQPYRRSVILLSKLLGVTKDNLDNDERLTPHPCIDLDLAEGCALVLGKSFAFAVEGGRLDGLVDRLAEDRERMLGQANKALAEWKDRQRKLARAAARPRPEPPTPAIHCEVRRNALGVYERVDD